MSPSHEGVHTSDTSACALWKQARCTYRWTSCRRRCARGRLSGRPLTTAPSRARTPGWCCRAGQASGPPGPPRCGTGQKICRAFLQPGLSSIGNEVERARVSARLRQVGKISHASAIPTSGNPSAHGSACPCPVELLQHMLVGSFLNGGHPKSSGRSHCAASERRRCLLCVAFEVL